MSDDIALHNEHNVAQVFLQRSKWFL